ncbi:MAG: GTPase ObgE, partial [Moraxellaceae bacterium]
AMTVCYRLMDAIDEQRELEAENPEFAAAVAARRQRLETEGREKIRQLAEKRKAARRAAQEAGHDLDDDDWNEDDYDVEFEYRP